MTDVRFYHPPAPGSKTPCRSCSSVRRARRPSVVRLATPARLKVLDEWLWTFDDTAFIPHGSEGQHAADQPVWLTLGEDNPAGAGFLFVGEGAELAGFEAFEVCAVLFDGRVEEAVARARSQWVAVAAAEAKEPASEAPRAQLLAAKRSRRLGAGSSFSGPALAGVLVQRREERCAWEGRRPRSGQTRARHRR